MNLVPTFKKKKSKKNSFSNDNNEDDKDDDCNIVYDNLDVYDECGKNNFKQYDIK